MVQSGFLSDEDVRTIGFANVGYNVLIDRTALFYGASRISIGSNVRIDAFSVLSAGAEGIKIGNHVHIAVNVFITGAALVELCDFSGLSARVCVYSSNDDYLGNALTGPTVPDEFRKVTNAPVSIGRHVVVGAGSIILPGVSIGEGAAVGALSLIKKNVRPFMVVAGPKGQELTERKKDFLEKENQLMKKERDSVVTGFKK
jgi:acetyltransferase-like isoleucine patch superfamily enzyme